MGEGSEFLSIYHSSEPSLIDRYKNDNEKSIYSDSEPLYSAVNIRAQHSGSLSIVDKMRGIQANRLDNDLGNISLAEMYADSKLDTRVGGGQYNVTITDIYADKTLFQAHHRLFVDGKIAEKESVLDYEMSKKEESFGLIASENEYHSSAHNKDLLTQNYNQVSFRDNGFSFNKQQLTPDLQSDSHLTSQFGGSNLIPQSTVSMPIMQKQNLESIYLTAAKNNKTEEQEIIPVTNTVTPVSYLQYIEKKEEVVEDTDTKSEHIFLQSKKRVKTQNTKYNENPFSSIEINKDLNSENKIITSEVIDYSIYIEAKERGLTIEDIQNGKKSIAEMSITELIKLKNRLIEILKSDNMELEKEKIEIELIKVNRAIIKKVF